MSSADILKQYCDGEREPVPGPLTYVEALALVKISHKLLESLKETAEALHGMADKRAAYYNAWAMIAEAEAAL